MSLYRDLKSVQKVPNPKRVLHDVHYIMDEMENDTFEPRVHECTLYCWRVLAVVNIRIRLYTVAQSSRVYTC